MKNNMKKGFTLIEVLIYIALFSLLLGTAFVAAYQLIDGSSKLSAKATTEEEGNFVLRKISWALTGDQTITTPSLGTPISSSLSLTKYDGNKIDVQKNGTKLELKESTNGNTFYPITTDNVVVTSLNFIYVPAQGFAPSGVTANATINGEVFSITKYIRK